MLNIGGSLGSIGKFIPDLLDGKVPPGSGGGIPNLDPQAMAKLGPMFQKVLYIAALHKAIEKAEKSASFNLETHKNDLWIRLGNISTQNVKKSGALAPLAGDITKSAGLLSNVIKALAQPSGQIGRMFKK